MNPSGTLKAVLGLAFWVALSFAAAAGGVAFRPGAWYLSIEKPSWTPPSSVFPPVWTLLYLMMGIAAWVVWCHGRPELRRLPLALFLLQLTLNATWSWLFFGLQSPTLGLVDILLLWSSLLATVYTFFKAHPAAGWLLAPYLGWVSFALALNFAIWRMN